MNSFPLGNLEKWILNLEVTLAIGHKVAHAEYVEQFKKKNKNE